MKETMYNGFDVLGAEVVKPPTLSLSRTAISLTAGAIAAVIGRKHPVLWFLSAAAAASNVQSVVAGDRTWPQAVRRMGRHVVAAVGSLSVPKFPALGYVAGAVAGDLLIDGEGNGIIDEWAPVDVLEAEYVEVPATKIEPNTQVQALVKK